MRWLENCGPVQNDAEGFSCESASFGAHQARAFAHSTAFHTASLYKSQIKHVVGFVTVITGKA